MPILNIPEFISDKTAIRDLFPTGQQRQYPVLYLWKITESTEELARMLPAEKRYVQEAHKRFNSQSRQKEWLATRVLLHQVLGKEAAIDYRETNKPYLPGSELEISISHTKGYTAIAFHTTSIGIDIEERSPRALSLISKFLREEEIKLLERGEEPEDKAICLWCAKEAAYKLFDLDSCSLQESITLTELPENLLATTLHPPQQAIVHFAIHEEFILALALQKNVTE